MREALNKSTGRYIDAADAFNAPWLFVCPECRAPVSLRAGGSKRPYFAHMPGRSSKDCHLYVEGAGYGAGVIALDPHDGEGAWELSLCLRLSGARNPRGWGLELMVPTAGLSGVEVSVDVGGRTEVVRGTTDSDYFRSVVAEPQCSSYEIVSVAPDDTAFAILVQRTCAGLAVDRATVFGEIARPMNQLAVRAHELRIGQTYAFVWPIEASPVFPEQLEHEPLKSRSGWVATLVTLSHPLQPEVQTWLRDFTGLPLSLSLPEIVPVWPPVLRKIIGTLCEATQNSPITLFAGYLTPTGPVGTATMFARSQRADVGAGAAVISEPFFRLSPDSEPFVELTSKDPLHAQLMIDFTLQSESPAPTAVELVGTDTYGTVKVVGLHNHLVVDWLHDIRYGDAKLSYLSVPLHVNGAVYVGQNGLWEQQLELRGSATLAPHDSGARLLSSSSAEQLAAILSRRRVSVLLDFGAFGRVYSEATLTAAAAAPAKLSRDLRERLLAYLFQTQRRSLPKLNSRHASDPEIVSAFLQGAFDVEDVARWRTLKAMLQAEKTQVGKKQGWETL